MIISDFTQPELDYLWDNCNFAGYEKVVFDLRSVGVSLEIIAEHLDLSVESVKKISRKVNKKIKKVL